MTGHWATDMVIHKPSLQQCRGQIGAAIWGTAGFGAPIGTDGKWVFVLSRLLSFSFLLSESPEEMGERRHST